MREVTTKGVTVSDIAQVLKKEPRTIRMWMNGEAVKNSKGAYILPECAFQFFLQNHQSKFGQEASTVEQSLRAALQEQQIGEDYIYHFRYIELKQQHHVVLDSRKFLQKDLADARYQLAQKESSVKLWHSRFETAESQRKAAETELQEAENRRKAGGNAILEIKRKLEQSETLRKAAETELQEAESRRKAAEKGVLVLNEKLQESEGHGKLKKAGQKFYKFSQSLIFFYGFMIIFIAAETFAHQTVTSQLFSTNVIHSFLAAGLFQVAGFLVYTSDSLKAAFNWDKDNVLNTVTAYNFLMNLAALFIDFQWAMSIEVVGACGIRILVALGFALMLKVIGTIIISKQKELV